MSDESFTHSSAAPAQETWLTLPSFPDEQPDQPEQLSQPEQPDEPSEQPEEQSEQPEEPSEQPEEQSEQSEQQSEQPVVEIVKLTRKQRYREAKDQEADTQGEVDEAALLSVVLQSVERRKQSIDQPRRGRGTINRFVARTQNAPGLGTVSPAAENLTAASDQLTLPEGEVPALEPGGTPVLPKFRPSTIGEPLGPAQGSASRLARGFLYLLAAAALLAGGFLAGRRTSPPAAVSAASKAPAAPGPAVWLPVYSAPLDKVLAADHAGDLAGALQLVNALIKTMDFNPALQAYRATLNTRLGLYADAESDLFGCINANTSPEVSATINAARAFNYVRWRRFGPALECFTTVAQAQPFDVPNLLCWGETLRRQGSFANAADKFQEALNRVPVTSEPAVQAQREYIAYERRLTLVENGREADLEPELDQHLSATAPSGYWLMTAAAVALENGDMLPAVDALKKAETVFSPEQFRGLLGDYFFHTFTYHAEMNAFPFTFSSEQQVARQSSMEYFLDP